MKDENSYFMANKNQIEDVMHDILFTHFIFLNTSSYIHR